MVTRLETRLHFDSTDEQPYRELDGGRKFTRGQTRLSVAAQDIEATVEWDGLTYWAADGSASYVLVMHFAGRLGERSGEFAMTGSGGYDGSTARVNASIVPGSGTGELAGIRGTATSVSTHADYPHMPLRLDYELD